MAEEKERFEILLEEIRGNVKLILKLGTLDQGVKLRCLKNY
jgi:hypothetical protein